MNLMLIWMSFLLLMGFSEELEQIHYLLFSSFMFYFTYIHNQLNPGKMSAKTAILAMSIPSIIAWYVAFVYNDFLCLTPVSCEFLTALLFIHVYLTIYGFFEHKMGITRKRVLQRFLNVFVTSYFVSKFNYQLDFLIPLIWPDLTSFKKTVLEKFVNLWKVFLFIVLTHLFDKTVFEPCFDKLDSL